MPENDGVISAGPNRPMTYYDVLDLDRDATADEIKAAYYQLSRIYHPDVAKDDPTATQRFATLSEAYRVLSDARRKHQYDRTLPQKSYPLRHPNAQKIWREATDVVLLRSDRFGPLNQAMQATLSVCLDGSLLVLTVPGSERHLVGHMETAANRNAIVNALELVCGRRLDFRIIDGTTVDDWEALKKAEQRARETARAGEKKEPAAAASASIGSAVWDELVQRIHRGYQEVPKRQYPQAKAQFLREALGWLIRTEEEERFAPGADEEVIERAVARVIERIAAVVSLPPVFVAVHLDNVKRSGDF